MTDTPSENTSGTTTAGAAGQQTTLQQLATVVAAAVVQALAASGAQTAQQQGAQQGTAQTYASSSSQEEVQSQLASLQDDLKKLSDHVSQVTAGDVDRATHSTIRTEGYANPIAEYMRIGTYAEQNLANSIANADALMKTYLRAIEGSLKYSDGVWARSLDHFGALPPIAPRSPTGPGVSAG